MSILIAYDSWALAKVKVVLDWLYEWLSISQKVVERVCIVGYATGNGLEIVGIVKHEVHLPLGFEIFMACMITAWMWHFHCIPSSDRTFFNTSGGMVARMLWHVFVLLSCISFCESKTIFSTGHIMEDASYVSMLYLFAVNSDGERGRKRKLALSKLKELFSWLPEPVPEGA